MSKTRSPNGREFAQMLCVRAGSMMEDICSEAVLVLPADTDERSERISRLSSMAEDAAGLLKAAEIWLRTGLYR